VVTLEALAADNVSVREMLEKTENVFSGLDLNVPSDDVI